MSKNVWIGLLALLSIAVLLFGSIHWKNKTTITVSADSNITVETASESAEAAEQEQADASAPVSGDQLESYLANWPEAAKEKFLAKAESGEPFTFVIAGSDAMQAENGGWPNKLKEKLLDTFGPERIEVKILETSHHSLDYIKTGEYKELVEAKPDLVLYEPLTLNDNGYVIVEHSHENLEIVMARVKEANPDAVFVIQPPHPLYNATYYPRDVEALEEYVTEKGYPYVDHWSAWPDQDDDALVEYLNADGDAPSPTGHEVWGQYLVEYFIAD